MRWAGALLLGGTLAACAPPAHFRPASALVGSRKNEVGAGSVAITPRPYVDEPSYLAGQIWYSRRFGSWFRGSLVAAFDDDALLGGIAAAAIPIHTDRVAAGVEVEVGFAWGAGSLPLALRLFDRTWLYAAPRLSTWGRELSPSVTGGLDAGLVDGVVLRAELSASWAEVDPYNRRYHVGGAAVIQW